MKGSVGIALLIVIIIGYLLQLKFNVDDKAAGREQGDFFAPWIMVMIIAGGLVAGTIALAKIK